MHLDKAPDAFRTISEVADDLDVPQHVLRFWETRFAQIKPMKRSGGRRYYRPDDVNLLRGIRRLLYGEGYTIRGVQRILREHGVKAVQNLTDESPEKASALFEAPRFEDVPDHHEDEELETTEEAEEEDDTEAFEEDEPESEPPVHSAMNFTPTSPLRGVPVPPVAVVPKPVAAKPAEPTAGGSAGAAAYAPPSIRNSTAKPIDQGKLKAVLDDLIDARAMIDRALNEKK